ncbi:hypothetical protein E2562_036661 [Oryza meyeriana var. granulata]|uniref:Myb-like domain-containing protein n=1 Tax=Oryza meyeriana var. granulata TaxID=110450 RepID=A0A6G1FG50_9ORYZ|nr:hypothetical protein E2562_036661 [Oryza meyeriana var. granulata]
MPVEDPQPLAMARMLPAAADLGFLSMSSESESDDESDDDEEEAVAAGGGHGGGDDNGEGNSRKLMAMFEGMMRQVTEKQDAMQRLFLETLEKWEAERTEREEAWRRKEVIRMNRERDILSQERAAAASRDAALIAFLQRVGGGEPVNLSPSGATATRAPVPAPPTPHHGAAVAGLQLVPVQPRAKAEEGWAAGGEGSGTTAPSRWPKEEVQALIDLRMEKEERYNDMGPKGPLWEEIAAGMQRIGYNRSAKRCKEKWENINKYFKKVKESNKRRPEDSKTCPYFHQLDAIYRKKHLAGRGSSAGGVTIASGSSLAIITVSEQENPSQRELEGKSCNDGNVPLAVPLLGNKAADKTTEGTVAEPNITGEETDSDEMGGNYSDEGDDNDKMQYKIEFQKPNAGAGDNAPAPTTTAATASSTPTSNISSLAVQ